MQAPSEHMTAPAVRALLKDGALAGDWVLDPRRSSVRVKSRSMWGLAAVNGVFREVSGNGTVSADGAVTGTGTLTVRGRTRPLSFDAAATVPGDREIWLDAEVRIGRADFGLTWNQIGMASMNNALTIHALFTRP